MGTEGVVDSGDKTKSEEQQVLMEAVVARDNLKRAYKQVMKNEGAAGVEGMDCGTLEDHLKRHWLTIKTKLLEGKYIPQAVRKVEIPKANGGVRTLGIPTVMDRLIQQALHQVLQPMFEVEFSGSSYGFRPGIRTPGSQVPRIQHDQREEAKTQGINRKCKGLCKESKSDSQRRSRQKSTKEH